MTRQKVNHSQSIEVAEALVNLDQLHAPTIFVKTNIRQCECFNFWELALIRAQVRPFMRLFSLPKAATAMPLFTTDEHHHFLLEIYFFKFIDQGIPASETPLFTGSFENRNLTGVIQEWFSVSEPEAIAMLDAARKEVEL